MGLEVITTPFGKFQIDPQDQIGMTTKAGTLWDGPGFLQPLALEYGRLGEPGTTILDVGANIGQFSVWLASQGAWRVIAVEALPETMLRLKANLDLNKPVTAEHVIPLEIAAYDRHTRLALNYYDPHNLGGTNFTPTAGEVTVTAAPLDDYAYCFGDRVSLIKIDTQGCDGLAILGLRETIRTHHPAIIFEWEEELACAHKLNFGHLIGLPEGETLKCLDLPWVTNFLSSLGYAVHEWPSQPRNFLAVAQSPFAWQRAK